jgi:hypothetical protein
MSAQPTVPGIALSKVEAAHALGMSVRSLDKYVVPDVNLARDPVFGPPPTEGEQG